MSTPIHLGFMWTVGKRIRVARELREMSQMDLSKKAGLSQSTIAQIEKGNKEPSLTTLRSIANGLGLEPWVFLYPNISLEMLAGHE